jgi:hypothetical protein
MKKITLSIVLIMMAHYAVSQSVAYPSTVVTKQYFVMSSPNFKNHHLKIIHAAPYLKSVKSIGKVTLNSPNYKNRVGEVSREAPRPGMLMVKPTTLREPRYKNSRS